MSLSRASPKLPSPNESASNARKCSINDFAIHSFMLHFRDAHAAANEKAKATGQDMTTLWSYHNYAFLLSSSITTLRGHIEAYHMDDYLHHVAAGEWKNQLPTFRGKEKEQRRQAEEDLREIIPPYSPENLCTLLSWWIVATDQVRSHT